MPKVYIFFILLIVILLANYIDLLFYLFDTITPLPYLPYRYEVLNIRSYGRAGNIIYGYTYMRLVAIQLGKPTITEFDLPYPFNGTKGIEEEPPFHADIGLEVPNIILFPDYLKFSLLKNHRRLIQEAIFPEASHTVSKKYDLVIHVRLDDCFNSHKLYTILVPDFYKRVFANLSNKRIATVAIVGRPTEPIHFFSLRKLETMTRRAFETDDVSVFTDSDISNDWMRIMQAPILVASVSTFWVVPSFVSPVVQEVHLPLFGQNIAMDFSDNPSENYTITMYDNIPMVKDREVAYRLWEQAE